MSAIRIEFVRIGDNLLPRTFSDRWNCVTLGIPESLPYDRNQTALKRLRRAHNPVTGDVAFLFTLVKGEAVSTLSDAEREAMASPVNIPCEIYYPENSACDHAEMTWDGFDPETCTDRYHCPTCNLPVVVDHSPMRPYRGIPESELAELLAMFV